METFTQPKIAGYRQLTQDEVALMNEGKALAEQDGHIYRLREQISRDTAQIERMRAALVAARAIVADDRKSLYETVHWPDGSIDPADRDALNEYDALLGMIDAAMEAQ